MTDKTLLILDLDETLVYGTERPLDRDPDLLASSHFVYFRPGLDNFIRHVASRGCVDVGIQKLCDRDLFSDLC